MDTEHLFEEQQQFHSVDDLMQKAAANKGELSGIAISEDKVVKEAEALGLIKVREADGWSMHDTVHLTPRSRLNAGLPPIVRRPSAASVVLHTIAAFAMRVFGKSRTNS
ncbi:hypothetical protein FHX15_001762 [Rhizobium sp. BK650]|uniref:hypothetical protein n=1 Tax=Rhizobium sp. BK650 TaxID=2586990 RepID=UPI00160D382D|nr:hypothetical protein [Rhizobium sp. BK650]MBB3656534.1 hypothetical protein [Rhizobium sp. BK650]